MESIQLYSRDLRSRYSNYLMLTSAKPLACAKPPSAAIDRNTRMQFLSLKAPNCSEINLGLKYLSVAQRAGIKAFSWL